MGNDHRRVSDDRNHRMLTVDGALPDVCAWMRMHIAKYVKRCLAAELPEGRIASVVKLDTAVLVGVRVQIIVKDESRHLPDRSVLRTEQKSAAFLPAVAPLAEFQHRVRP